MKKLNLKESICKIKMFMTLALIVFFAFPTFQALSSEQPPTSRQIEDMGMTLFYGFYGHPGAGKLCLALDENKTGHIRKSAQWNGLITFISPEDYRAGNYKVGQPLACFLNIYTYPPGNQGMGLLFETYAQERPFDPKKEIYPQYWMYSTATRRVSELSAPARSDSVRGTPFANDDTWGVRPEYETRTYLGTDILRPEDYTAGSLKEPVECWVLESKSKLPDYYLSKRLVWYDKKSLMPLREEQYDKNGILYKIAERHFFPLKENPGIGDWCMDNIRWWDLSIDFHYYGPIQGIHPMMKFPVIQKAYDDFKNKGEFPLIFTPEYMKQELKGIWGDFKVDQSLYQSARSGPWIKLLRDRFPGHRKIELPEETLERIKKEIEK